MKEINVKAVAITFAVALVIWFIAAPKGVAENAWHLFAIFAATILRIILKAAPIGTMCIMAIGFTALMQVVDPIDEGKSITKALSGFGNKVIWLIGISFFIAKGFIKTGLGNRIAFLFIRIFERSSLGLAYGFGLADVCLAPAIPSNTARGGGITYPMKSIPEKFLRMTLNLKKRKIV